MKTTFLVAAGGLLGAACSLAAYAEEDQPQAVQTQTVEIVAKKLNEARNDILPDTGGSVYRITQDDIANLPLGESTPFNSLLLQAPGVVQDSFGQLHIRGEHANLQYRINGVIIPESISGFGQTLDPRFFSDVNFLTGALPAEYGYRTAGIVDIHTKSGALDPGGTVGLLGGSFKTVNPYIQYGGTSGKFDYYITGQYLYNQIGIENPTASYYPIHDDTNQGKGFAYASYLLNDTSRISVMVGAALGYFQIPNNPSQMPQFSLDGGPAPTPFDSANLNENQREATNYGAVAFQGKTTGWDYQVAFFSRYTSTYFTPDPSGGDLIFNGVSSTVYQSGFANGLQGDAAYPLNATNTLRTGFLFSAEQAISNTTSQVFPTDAAGNQVPGAGPTTIVDNHSKTGYLYGIYVQDEWRPTQVLTINYGVRFDYVDAYITEYQLSPRVGMVYELSPRTSLHAAYARYFTPPPLELVAPTDIALFANTTNAPEVTTDDPVKSERSNYFDVGVIHSPIPGWSVGLDAYYKHSQNLLDEGQFGAAVIFEPFNYAKGYAAGVELTNSYHKGPFGAYLNIAWAQAEGTNINSAQFNFGAAELQYIATHYIYLDHNQTWTVSGGVSYLWDKTTLTADLLFGSGLREDSASGVPNGASVGSYTTVNLGAFRAFNLGAGLGEVKGRIAVINLFDKSYLIRSGSGVGVGAPQYGMPRAFFVEISKAFR